MKYFIVALFALSFVSCKTEVQSASADEVNTDSKETKKIEGEHKPPIEKSAVKDGHWYCDMGTVHYSRADKGDGKCPLCGMKLHHKSAEK